MLPGLSTTGFLGTNWWPIDVVAAVLLDANGKETDEFYWIDAKSIQRAPSAGEQQQALTAALANPATLSEAATAARAAMIADLLAGQEPGDVAEKYTRALVTGLTGGFAPQNDALTGLFAALVSQAQSQIHPIVLEVGEAIAQLDVGFNEDFRTAVLTVGRAALDAGENVEAAIKTALTERVVKPDATAQDIYDAWVAKKVTEVTQAAQEAKEEEEPPAQQVPPAPPAPPAAPAPDAPAPPAQPPAAPVAPVRQQPVVPETTVAPVQDSDKGVRLQLLITSAMRAELRRLGYTPAQIAQMKPSEAALIIEKKQPSPVQPAAPVVVQPPAAQPPAPAAEPQAVAPAAQAIPASPADPAIPASPAVPVAPIAQAAPVTSQPEPDDAQPEELDLATELWRGIWKTLDPRGYEWFVAAGDIARLTIERTSWRVYQTAIVPVRWLSTGLRSVTTLPARITRRIPLVPDAVSQRITDGKANVAYIIGRLRTNIWTGWAFAQTDRSQVRATVLQIQQLQRAKRLAQQRVNDLAVRYRTDPENLADTNRTSGKLTEVGRARGAVLLIDRQIAQLFSQLVLRAQTSSFLKILDGLASVPERINGPIRAFQSRTTGLVTYGDSVVAAMNAWEEEVAESVGERQDQLSLAWTALRASDRPGFAGGFDAVWSVVVDPYHLQRRELRSLTREQRRLNRSLAEFEKEQAQYKKDLAEANQDIAALENEAALLAESIAETKIVRQTNFGRLIELETELNAEVVKGNLADEEKKAELAVEIDRINRLLSSPSDASASEKRYEVLLLELAAAQHDRTVLRGDVQKVGRKLSANRAEILANSIKQTEFAGISPRPGVGETLERLASFVGLSSAYRGDVAGWTFRILGYYAGGLVDPVLEPVLRAAYETKKAVFETSKIAVEALYREAVWLYRTDRAWLSVAEGRLTWLEESRAKFEEFRNLHKNIAELAPALQAYWQEEFDGIRLELIEHNQFIAEHPIQGEVDTVEEVETYRRTLLVEVLENRLVQLGGYLRFGPSVDLTVLLRGYYTAVDAALAEARAEIRIAGAALRRIESLRKATYAAAKSRREALTSLGTPDAPVGERVLPAAPGFPRVLLSMAAAFNPQIRAVLRQEAAARGQTEILETLLVAEVDQAKRDEVIREAALTLLSGGDAEATIRQRLEAFVPKPADIADQIYREFIGQEAAKIFAQVQTKITESSFPTSDEAPPPATPSGPAVPPAPQAPPAAPPAAPAAAPKTAPAPVVDQNFVDAKARAWLAVGEMKTTLGKTIALVNNGSLRNDQAQEIVAGVVASLRLAGFTGISANIKNPAALRTALIANIRQQTRLNSVDTVAALDVLNQALRENTAQLAELNGRPDIVAGFRDSLIHFVGELRDIPGERTPAVTEAVSLVLARLQAQGLSVRTERNGIPRSLDGFITALEHTLNNPRAWENLTEVQVAQIGIFLGQFAETLRAIPAAAGEAAVVGDIAAGLPAPLPDQPAVQPGSRTDSVGNILKEGDWVLITSVDTGAQNYAQVTGFNQKGRILLTLENGTRTNIDPGETTNSGKPRIVRISGKPPDGVQNMVTIKGWNFSTGEQDFLLFDESASIDAANGEFLGEVGIGVAAKTEDGKNVLGFDFWMFDKNDIQTVSMVLADRNVPENVKANLQQKSDDGEIQNLTNGASYVLESATLVSRITVSDVVMAGVPGRGYVQNASFAIEVWQKLEPTNLRPQQPPAPPAPQDAPAAPPAAPAADVPILKQTKVIPGGTTGTIVESPFVRGMERASIVRRLTDSLPDNIKPAAQAAVERVLTGVLPPAGLLEALRKPQVIAAMDALRSALQDADDYPQLLALATRTILATEKITPASITKILTMYVTFAQNLGTVNDQSWGQLPKTADEFILAQRDRIVRELKLKSSTLGKDELDSIVEQFGGLTWNRLIKQFEEELDRALAIDVYNEADETRNAIVSLAAEKFAPQYHSAGRGFARDGNAHAYPPAALVEYLNLRVVTAEDLAGRIAGGWGGKIAERAFLLAGISDGLREQIVELSKQSSTDTVRKTTTDHVAELVGLEVINYKLKFQSTTTHPFYLLNQSELSGIISNILEGRPSTNWTAVLYQTPYDVVNVLTSIMRDARVFTKGPGDSADNAARAQIQFETYLGERGYDVGRVLGVLATELGVYTGNLFEKMIMGERGQGTDQGLRYEEIVVEELKNLLIDTHGGLDAIFRRIQAEVVVSLTRKEDSTRVALEKALKQFNDESSGFYHMVDPFLPVEFQVQSFIDFLKDNQLLSDAELAGAKRALARGSTKARNAKVKEITKLAAALRQRNSEIADLKGADVSQVHALAETVHAELLALGLPVGKSAPKTLAGLVTKIDKMTATPVLLKGIPLENLEQVRGSLIAFESVLTGYIQETKVAEALRLETLRHDAEQALARKKEEQARQKLARDAAAQAVNAALALVQNSAQIPAANNARSAVTAARQALEAQGLDVRTADNGIPRTPSAFISALQAMLVQRSLKQRIPDPQKLDQVSIILTQLAMDLDTWIAASAAEEVLRLAQEADSAQVVEPTEEPSAAVTGELRKQLNVLKKGLKDAGVSLANIRFSAQNIEKAQELVRNAVIPAIQAKADRLRNPVSLAALREALTKGVLPAVSAFGATKDIQEIIDDIQRRIEDISEETAALAPERTLQKFGYQQAIVGAINGEIDVDPLLIRNTYARQKLEEGFGTALESVPEVPDNLKGITFSFEIREGEGLAAKDKYILTLSDGRTGEFLGLGLNRVAFAIPGTELVIKVDKQDKFYGTPATARSILHEKYSREHGLSLYGVQPSAGEISAYYSASESVREYLLQPLGFGGTTGASSFQYVIYPKADPFVDTSGQGEFLEADFAIIGGGDAENGAKIFYDTVSALGLVDPHKGNIGLYGGKMAIFDYLDWRTLFILNETSEKKFDKERLSDAQNISILGDSDYIVYEKGGVRYIARLSGLGMMIDGTLHKGEFALGDNTHIIHVLLGDVSAPSLLHDNYGQYYVYSPDAEVPELIVFPFLTEAQIEMFGTIASLGTEAYMKKVAGKPTQDIFQIGTTNTGKKYALYDSDGFKVAAAAQGTVLRTRDGVFIGVADGDIRKAQVRGNTIVDTTGEPIYEVDGRLYMVDGNRATYVPDGVISIQRNTYYNIHDGRITETYV